MSNADDARAADAGAADGAPPGLAMAPGADDHLRRAARRFVAAQDAIVAALEALEPSARFVVDDWTRPDGAAPDDDTALLRGGGRTRVLEGGEVFERAGVNVSLVWGRFSAAFAATMPHGDGRDFCATGLSLVLHPRNPYAPTVHLNVRRLQRGSAGWWGGGADLTPYYLDEADACAFHRGLRAVCARHPTVADYERDKAACDAYFRNGHRDEARGIGGIFFDGVHSDGDAGLALCDDLARAFLPIYLPIVSRHRRRPYGDPERRWQLQRRGRYVEFNLLHDRGTVFGLRTGGRTASILMSLPPLASWCYDEALATRPAEAALLEVLKTPRDWLAACPA